MSSLPPEARVWQWMVNGCNGCLDICRSWLDQGFYPDYNQTQYIRALIRTAQALELRINAHYGKLPHGGQDQPTGEPTDAR